MISHENSVAVFRCEITLSGGRGEGSATGWGSEGYDDFRDYLEKAETKAVGRALAALGFGTQFTPDFDFAEGQGKVVDAPVRLARARQLVDLAEQGPVNQQAQRMTQQAQSADRQSMTDRQMSFIRQMTREKGLSEEATDAQCQEIFGKPFNQLDRRDASAYIERLKSIEPLQRS
jgi:hypothetical protein